MKWPALCPNELMSRPIGLYVLFRYHFNTQDLLLVAVQLIINGCALLTFLNSVMKAASKLTKVGKVERKQCSTVKIALSRVSVMIVLF